MLFSKYVARIYRVIRHPQGASYCYVTCFFSDTCTCSTPGAGTIGKNQMTCSNGETRTCSSDQECYATEAFGYGQLSDGCRIPGKILCY